VKRLVACAVLLVWAGPAAAQSGPYTATLSLEEPRTVAFRLGPVVISPNLAVPEIGYDSNVFDEETNEKTDWTVKLTPRIDVYARAGLFQFAVEALSDFTYYFEYESERSAARQLRGRLNVELSKFRPWIAGAIIDDHDRPNREIDLRARRTDNEVSGGVAFEISSIAELYAMAAQTRERYGAEETFEGVNLDEALTHRGELMSAGLKWRATPFTTVLFDFAIDDTRFENAPERDSRTTTGSTRLEFAPDAIISGAVMLGVQNFNPVDEAVPPFKGFVTSGSLTYTLLGRGTVNTVLERSVRESFEIERQYYVETGLDLTYTHRVMGPWDVQGVGSRRWLDYTRVTPGLRPYVDTAGVGVGYNLSDGSRIGFNFEYAQRIDEERPDRKFHRRRVFGTYTIRR
jgi:hypothetical protein